MSSSKAIKNNSFQICAVIPFYNEKETLGKILNETLNYVNVIFAVNDGSDDGWIYENNNDRVYIINLDRNYGKGKALSAGFEAAKKNGIDKIITLDADLQHDPKYIPQLLKGLSLYDVVIGNRLKNITDMPIQRKMSNKLTSFLLSIKTGQKIIDSQCGFRVYRLEVIKSIQTRYPGFEAESEMIIRAAEKGYKIGFVDVPTIYGNETSKMKPFQAIIGFLRVLFSSTRN
ncbi:MAG: glycosyltransferase family 2 protein [bacterium]|nr:glycosyltransferase family 2 protein [bacterium]